MLIPNRTLSSRCVVVAENRFARSILIKSAVRSVGGKIFGKETGTKLGPQTSEYEATIATELEIHSGRL